MPKQKLENDSALIEATARQIAEGMGDDPDDMVYAGMLSKTRSGHTIIPKTSPVPAWTPYIAAAEKVLRYLLVERIVLVKRDKIDPAVKAKFQFDWADPTLGPQVKPISYALTAEILTEDDVTSPVHDALWTMVQIAAGERLGEHKIILMDALDMLSRIGYLGGMAANLGTFWSQDCAYKPSREGAWAVVQYAHSVNGIGSDFMWKAYAKLFPNAPASQPGA